MSIYGNDSPARLSPAPLIGRHGSGEIKEKEGSPVASPQRSLHSTKSDLVIGLMALLLYSCLGVAFFACLSINNFFLRVVNRTLATTLLTFAAMTCAMHAVYGGFDVGRKKSKPVISAMIAGTVFTVPACALNQSPERSKPCQGSLSGGPCIWRAVWFWWRGRQCRPPSGRSCAGKRSRRPWSCRRICRQSARRNSPGR